MKDQLSLPGFLDEPGFFDTLETWEQFLAELDELRDSVQKRQVVNNAKQVIAMTKWEYGTGQ